MSSVKGNIKLACQ